MNILFFILVGAVLAFIVMKAIEMNKKSDKPSDNSNGGGSGDSTNGGGGVSINTPWVTGELPKDNIK